MAINAIKLLKYKFALVPTVREPPGHPVIEGIDHASHVNLFIKGRKGRNNCFALVAKRVKRVKV
jgi:hypothetical protein